VRAHVDVQGRNGRGLVVAPPGLLQRILLTTDGNVGRILENYAGEAIVAVKLDQTSSPSGEDCHPLELAADDERLTRRVLLRGSTTGRTLLHAETLVAAARLHPLVRSGLLSTSEPIGRLLTIARLETFRDILSSGVTRAGAIGEHFEIGADEDVFVRTYRIVSGARPIMLITEKFPTTWFR
jgi:chorismate-pyruvate lyase